MLLHSDMARGTAKWLAGCTVQSSPSHLRRWEHWWGCAGRWFLFHIIWLQELLMLVTAGALSHLERPTLRQLCHQQWLLRYYHDKEFPYCLSLLAGEVSHCSMLSHHPTCSSLTIRGRLDRRFLKAYPDYNNFIWCKRLIEKWSTETAACSHTPELSHLLFWMTQQIYILSLHANWIPGTGLKFPSFWSHSAWNDHISWFTNAALEWKLLEAAQKCHKLPSI